MATVGLIVFRCDASPRVGIGHLRRCGALAGAAQERWDVLMVVRKDGAYRMGYDLARVDWPTTAATASDGGP